MCCWDDLQILRMIGKLNPGLAPLSLCGTLTHWGRDKMAAISQTTLSNAFSSMKMLRVSIEISLKFVPNGPINNITALVKIMAWRRPGDKPLSEPMMIRLPTPICVTRPQWVKITSLIGYLKKASNHYDMIWYSTSISLTILLILFLV